MKSFTQSELEKGMTKDTLVDLREKVRAAKGPDRDVDEGLCRLFGFDDFYFTLRHDTSSDVKTLGETEGFWTVMKENGRGSSANAGIQKRSASIDSALALVERVLPGWAVSTRQGGRHVSATIESGQGKHPYWALISPDGYGTYLDGPTLPLAILDALLSALIEKDSAHG